MNYEQSIEFIRAVHNTGTKLGYRETDTLKTTTKLYMLPEQMVRVQHAICFMMY